MSGGDAETNARAEAFCEFINRAAAALAVYNLPAAREIAKALRAADKIKTRRGKKPENALRRFPPADNAVRENLRKFCAAAPFSCPLLKSAAHLARDIPWRMSGNGRAKTTAVAELIGPDGLAECADIRAGLFFQPANIFYTWHKHAAEEIYLTIGGKATWHAENRAPQTTDAGGLIHHPPNQPHAMKTAAAPLLALWGWRGDINLETYAFCDAPAALPEQTA
ncbi:MAG: dimethylsulfonioproprionate lyase family protein [Gammaproteobacteria bacterium]